MLNYIHKRAKNAKSNPAEKVRVEFLAKVQPWRSSPKN